MTSYLVDYIVPVIETTKGCSTQYTPFSSSSVSSSLSTVIKKEKEHSGNTSAKKIFTLGHCLDQGGREAHARSTLDIRRAPDRMGMKWNKNVTVGKCFPKAKAVYLRIASTEGVYQ